MKFPLDITIPNLPKSKDGEFGVRLAGPAPESQALTKTRPESKGMFKPLWFELNPAGVNFDVQSVKRPPFGVVPTGSEIRIEELFVSHSFTTQVAPNWGTMKLKVALAVNDEIVGLYYVFKQTNNTSTTFGQYNLPLGVTAPPGSIIQLYYRFLCSGLPVGNSLGAFTAIVSSYQRPSRKSNVVERRLTAPQFGNLINSMLMA